MKKNLFVPIIAAAVIFSLYFFASADSSGGKILRIDIIGPNSVPENTQNVFHIAAIYDNNSIVEVTPDASITVNPDKNAVINLGGIIETFKLKQEKQFKICAKYQGFAAEKIVTIYPVQKNN